MDVSSNSWITQALRIASDLLMNYSRDLSNEKMSLTEAPRYGEKKEDSDSLSAASSIFARDMLLGCGRRPRSGLGRLP